MSDLVNRLREIENASEYPPEWLPANGWGLVLAALCGEAANEIQRLRSLAGVVSAGPSLAELKVRLSSNAGERTAP